MSDQSPPQSLAPPVLPSPLPTLPTPAEPVSAPERLESLDVLRGVALFGILLVNMPLFSWPLPKVFFIGMSWDGADRVADFAVRFLAEGKFYILFSVLFGAGAALQMERAAARGAAFCGRYVRRLLALMAIGLVHAFLIWEGDILMLYAALGFLLLPFRACRPRTLLWWAGGLVLLLVVICAAAALMFAAGRLVPGAAGVMEGKPAEPDAAYAAWAEQDIEIFARGGIGEILAVRARNVALLHTITWIMGPTALAMFLLGVWAVRRGVFQDPNGRRAFIRKVAIAGWAAGLPLNLLYAILHELTGAPGCEITVAAATAIIMAGGPVLGLGYGATLLLLLRHEPWQRLLRPVAAAGRMGLSNYLFQSIVCTLIFYSYGLGLFGSVGRVAGVGIAAGIYATQVALSVAWLRHFRFGPAEWVWRGLTYGKRQPFRARGRPLTNPSRGSP